jgi:hypothetical protein
MADSDVEALLVALRRKQDRAMMALMLDGALRPGEGPGAPRVASGREAGPA